MRRILPLVVTALAAACGSQWHLPGENITMPSNVSVGSGQQGQNGDGHVSASDIRSTDAGDAIQPVPVLAHYVSWHVVPGGWTEAATMPIRRDNPAGGYDSKNPVIIAEHNAEMSANGILPMVSWWAKDTYSGDAFLDVYLSIPGPKIAILYEAVGPGRLIPTAVRGSVRALSSGFPASSDDPSSAMRLSRTTVGNATTRSGDIDMGDPRNAEIFISDMEHLQTKYFSKYPDRFFRIDGRPVVFIWLSHAFTGPFEQVANRAREHSSFYLIGSEFTTPWGMGSGHETVVRAMDAITSYGFYDIGRYSHDMDDRFIADYLYAVRTWSTWLAANSPRTKIILPVQFSYDDRTIPGREGLYFGSSYEVARRYARVARWFTENPCGIGRVLPVVYTTSYNEHYEGSAVEPNDRYQDNYLRILRETFAGPPPPSTGTSCPAVE